MQREEEAEEEQMMRMCDGGKVESTLNEEESRRITMGAGISSCQSANTVHIAADKSKERVSSLERNEKEKEPLPTLILQKAEQNVEDDDVVLLLEPPPPQEDSKNDTDEDGLIIDEAYRSSSRMASAATVSTRKAWLYEDDDEEPRRDRRRQQRLNTPRNYIPKVASTGCIKDLLSSSTGAANDDDFLPILHPAISNTNLTAARLKASPIVGKKGDIFNHPAIVLPPPELDAYSQTSCSPLSTSANSRDEDHHHRSNAESPFHRSPIQRSSLSLSGLIRILNSSSNNISHILAENVVRSLEPNLKADLTFYEMEVHRSLGDAYNKRTEEEDEPRPSLTLEASKSSPRRKSHQPSFYSTHSFNQDLLGKQSSIDRFLNSALCRRPNLSSTATSSFPLRRTSSSVEAVAASAAASRFDSINELGEDGMFYATASTSTPSSHAGFMEKVLPPGWVSSGAGSKNKYHIRGE